MKTFRIICLLATIVIILFHLFNINYSNLSSKSNTSHYIGLFAMILVANGFIFGILKKNKNEKI